MQANDGTDHAAQNLNTILLRKLSSAVNGHAATATFACGGSIPISDLHTSNFGPGKQNIFPSVKVRWDTNDYGCSSLSFPLHQHDDVSRERFNDLLRICQPATFGRDGQDVLDETYRKAGKLDTSAFLTNFHPHDYGIVDSIQQILLPSTIRGGQGVGIGPQGVRIELYKLNVYSAPFGKFLPHVDTPRGATQFGSLVVCLPCEHEGGTLRVKHRGQTMDFAWASTSSKNLQWAAFYGDCEHEVLEVTKGHRITLTYNLHYSWIGDFGNEICTTRHLPLFNIVRDMLQEPNFMREGGVLGFFCHHQYAHSQESGRKSIPNAFKGVNLAIYSVFHMLGLKVGIHPVIQNKSENMGGMSAKDLMQGPPTRGDSDYVQYYLHKKIGLMSPDEDNEDLECEDDKDKYHDDFDDEKEENTTIVGTALHGPTFDQAYEEESHEPVSDAWPHQKVPQILWMNEPTHKDFAYSGLAYGNQAELNYQFSAATILVVVPASKNRTLASLRPVDSAILNASQVPSPNPTSNTFDTPVGPTVGANDPVSAQSSSADTTSRQLTPMSATPCSESTLLRSNWSEEFEWGSIEQGGNRW